jgi:hypothetical protein
LTTADLEGRNDFAERNPASKMCHPNEAKDLCTQRQLHRSFVAKDAAQYDKASKYQSVGFFRSVFQLGTLAGIDDLFRIDSVFVHLLFHDLSIFSDQEVHASRRLIFVFVDAVFVGYFSAPIAEKGEGHSNLVGEGFVGEGTIHAHTQDLGVGCFQRFQVLLEVFHLLRSTTGKGEDIERQDDVLLAAVVA